MTTPTANSSGITKTPASSSTAPIWRLNSGADRRVKAGHPWVYSNELQKSPKGITPGQKVMLADAGGKFLAWGYGNPASLIAFRVLSRVETDAEAGTVSWFKEKLKAAWYFRKDLGLTESSCRWVHGEGDGLPGLIIDRYVMASKTPTEVLVVQAHTAGMDHLMGSILEAIEVIMQDRKTEWGLVIRNDASSRKFEGLEIQEPVIHRKWEGNSIIQVRGVGRKATPFKVDLKAGQKTGFFLDQSENIHQVGEILLSSNLPKTVRILDLCPYVGQWSTKLTQALRAKGHDVQVTLMDSSKDALNYAEENVKNAGAQVVKAIQGDVMEDLKNLTEKSYEIVISDPPAFIKGRKDIGVGTAAYVKLNTEAFRLVAPNGFVAACSCSQLLSEEDFMTVLSKASRRNGRDTRWIARGTQSMDHPVRLEFNEGKYLKMWLGKVSE